MDLGRLLTPYLPGDAPPAFDGLGVPMAECVSLFEEFQMLVDHLLTEDAISYDDKYYTLSDMSVQPYLGAPDEHARSQVLRLAWKR